MFMTFLYLHTDDRAWMLQRLRSSARGMTALLVLSAVMHDPADVRGSSGAATVPVTGSVAVVSTSSSEVQTASITGRQPNPVPPVGWRRTNRGWEHVSTWPTAEARTLSPNAAASINELILNQRASESAWLQTILGRLRQIPPLMFSVMQITAIAVIALCARRCPRVA